MKLDTKLFTYCPFCGQKLRVAEDDGMFDGKGSTYCPVCGLIHRKKPNNQSTTTREARREREV